MTHSLGLPVPAQGLYRTTVAGPGRSLPEAFASVERSPRVERLLRHTSRDLMSARVTLGPDEGRGYWELTRIRQDLYVVVGNYAYDRTRIEYVPGDGLVQFNFKLSGDMTYAPARPGPIRFNRPALHLWRQPHGIDMHEWTAPASHERLVTISVHHDFLVDQFLDPSEEVPARLRPFAVAPRDSIDFFETPLTAPMVDTITRLLDNPYTGTLYLSYQEALTTELLCVAMAGIQSPLNDAAAGYSEQELRRLSAARELLTRQFAPVPTLQQIATFAGLSVKGLTRGFRAVYGDSVSDFGLHCRMQHALTLLRDRRWSVDRTSEAVGYSHPTSFATAFQRHFGVRPIDMRRLKGHSGKPRPPRP